MKTVKQVNFSSVQSVSKEFLPFVRVVKVLAEKSQCADKTDSKAVQSESDQFVSTDVATP